MKDSESGQLFNASDENQVHPSSRKTRLPTIPTFKALEYRNFALLWFGLILSNIGTWIQIIAQSLLVLALTHNSGVALGVVSFAQAFPFFIFALLGGGIADRADKRKLLLFTQSVQNRSRLHSWNTYLHRFHPILANHYNFHVERRDAEF